MYDKDTKTNKIKQSEKWQEHTSIKQFINFSKNEPCKYTKQKRLTFKIPKTLINILKYKKKFYKKKQQNSWMWKVSFICI